MVADIHVDADVQRVDPQRLLEPAGGLLEAPGHRVDVAEGQHRDRVTGLKRQRSQQVALRTAHVTLECETQRAATGQADGQVRIQREGALEVRAAGR